MTLGWVCALRVDFRERGAGDLGLVADVEGCWTEIVGQSEVDTISSCGDSLIGPFSVMRYAGNGLGIKCKKEIERGIQSKDDLSIFDARPSMLPANTDSLLHLHEPRTMV